MLLKERLNAYFKEQTNEHCALQLWNKVWVCIF